MADEMRLAEVLASVLERRERGEPVDAETVIREHPSLAEELRVHFAAAQFVDVALAGLAPHAAPAPERIGSFRIERELGTGGMGTVYAATAGEDAPGMKCGERVALKVVHPHLLRRPGFFRRFVREAELGRRVRHENVVRTLFVDAALDGDVPCHFLAMEYVEGQTLRELLVEVERVPEELCLHVAREVVKGLAAIHAAGIVHRDVKPENVIIAGDHQVKVMDLGLAQLADEGMRLSQPGAFVGSIHYAAPEQIDDREHVDGRADLFALGLVLYELSTGIHPYGDGGPAAVMRKVLDATPRRCAEVNPQLSPFFEEVVHTLLAKKRDERFADDATLLAVLVEGERSPWWTARATAIRAATQRPLRRIRISRETAIHGRDAELGRIRSLFEKAKAGDGQVVLLEGEAGIGKSRLVDEFVARLQSGGEDVNFVFGTYPPGGAATASGAFATAYREEFGDAGLEDALRAHLTATPLLVPAFAALLRGDAAPAGTEPLTKDSLQTVFVHTTRSLAAQRTTIVCIDDLHFAPGDGRALFASLAMAVPGHRILLVGSMRPGIPGNWVASLSRLEQTTRIAVPRLGPKDLVHLLRDALRSEHLAHELAGLIAEKSDGNPYFIFEIVRGLRDGGLLRQRPDGAWESTQVLRNITVPSSVLDLVNARVAELGDEERNLLDLASCAGFEFDAGVVADAAGMPLLVALKRLAQIERRHGLVRAAGRVFVFDHHQVREALHDALPAQLREAYHAAIGDALLRRDGAASKDPDELPGALSLELADHLLRGAQGRRALRYLDAALTHCERNYLNEVAVRLAEQALAVPGLLEGRRRFDMLLRKEHRLDLLGRRDERRAVAEQALAIARELADRQAESDALGTLGSLLSESGQFEEARALHEQRLALARQEQDPLAEAKVLGNLGIALLGLGRSKDALALQLRSRELAVELGDRLGEANAVGNIGNAAFTLGRPDEARAWYEQQLELARTIGDRRGQANATGNLGNVHAAAGRGDLAMAHYRRHLELARAIGDRRGEAIATLNAGEQHQRLGQFDEARDHFERCLALSREIGARLGEAFALGNLGNTFSALGRLDEALRVHEQSLEIAKSTGHRAAQASQTGHVGQVQALLGRGPEARATYQAQLAAAREIGDRIGEGSALHDLACIAADEGADQDAERAFDQALEVRRTLGARANEAETLGALGALRVRQGRIAEARDCLDAAGSIAKELGRFEIQVAVAAQRAAALGGDAEEAVSLFASHRPRLGVVASMGASFLLWQATRDRAYLAEAGRHLDFLVEHAPPGSRPAMLANVRLHREIAAARNAEDGERHPVRPRAVS